MGWLSDLFPYATAPYVQLTAALEQSANLGNSINGEPQYRQACNDIAAGFNSKLNFAIRYFSFDTNGDGIGNFQICCTFDDEAARTNPGVYYDDLIIKVQGILSNAGVSNYTLFTDREAGKFIFTTHAVPGLDNTTQEETQISDEKTPRSPSSPTTSSSASGNPKPTAAIGVLNEKGEAPVYGSERTASSRKKVSKASTDTNEFYKNCIVLIEGIQVPYNQISVSYGVTAPPTCTIIIPAHKVIREVMKYAPRVHVFFEDLLPDSDGTYEYRLLFDGFLTSFSYGSSSDGAQMSLNGLHSCAYLQLMQIMTLDPAQYLFNTSQWIAGTSTIPIMFGQNRVHSAMIEAVCNQKVKTMADLVFKMLQGILLSDNQTATAKYYRKVLGNDPGGWKILKRIFGVSKYAQDSAIPQTSWDKSQLTKSGASSSKSGATNNARVDNPELTHITNRLAFPCTGPITSPFGPREAPVDGASTDHKGIDIGADTGTPVRATGEGTVITAGYYEGCGNLVELSHNGGTLITQHMHLSEITVNVGDEVKTGDLIGLVGSTGYSSGPHLHFGVKNNGVFENPCNWF